MYKRALVRPPASNFAEGLTTAGLGKPDIELAFRQHDKYCLALKRCGVGVIRLSPDPRFPDSTFVEDTAVVSGRSIVVTRPGAESRRLEAHEIIPSLNDFFPKLDFIQPPGLIDGGDVCIAGKRLFIGISDRTNEEGAHQLASYFSAKFLKTEFIDIRGINGLLHLKSAISYIGDNRLVAWEALADRPEFAGLDIVPVTKREQYAANCIRVNDHVLNASGFPKLAATLERLGYNLIPLDLSEFRKMDGSLSCLSLLF